MPGSRIRLKLVGPRSASSYKSTKETCWKNLKELEGEKFIPGALREMGPRAHSLSIRRGEKVESWYVPRSAVKEVRELADRYRRARELLAKIADAELSLLKLRVAANKQSAKTRAGRGA